MRVADGDMTSVGLPAGDGVRVGVAVRVTVGVVGVRVEAGVSIPLVRILCFYTPAQQQVNRTFALAAVYERRRCRKLSHGRRS